jgi:hypothetical protein
MHVGGFRRATLRATGHATPHTRAHSKAPWLWQHAASAAPTHHASKHAYYKLQITSRGCTRRSRTSATPPRGTHRHSHTDTHPDLIHTHAPLDRQTTSSGCRRRSRTSSARWTAWRRPWPRCSTQAAARRCVAVSRMCRCMLLACVAPVHGAPRQPGCVRARTPSHICTPHPSSTHPTHHAHHTMVTPWSHITQQGDINRQSDRVAEKQGFLDVATKALKHAEVRKCTQCVRARHARTLPAVVACSRRPSAAHPPLSQRSCCGTPNTLTHPPASFDTSHITHHTSHNTHHTTNRSWRARCAVRWRRRRRATRW